MKNILLMGGGFDSVALFFAMLHETVAFEMMVVDYHQRAFKAELYVANKLASKFNVNLYLRSSTAIRDVNPQPNLLLNGKQHPNPYVIGRNYYLLNEAARLGDNIWIGLSKGVFEDCSEIFVDYINGSWVYAFSGKKIVSAPWVNAHKKYLVALGEDLASQRGVDYHDYIATCWDPDYDKPPNYGCGTCKHCIEKIKYEHQTELMEQKKIELLSAVKSNDNSRN